MADTESTPVLQTTEQPAAPAPASRNVLGIKIGLLALDGGQQDIGPFATVEFVRPGRSREYFHPSLASYLRAVRCLRHVGRDVVTDGADSGYGRRLHISFANQLQQGWEGRS